MLMQDDRNANPSTAVKNRTFDPRPAGGSGRPDGPATAAAAAGLAARAGLPTPIARGPGGETGAADNNFRPRFDDCDFPATLLAMAGHDLRQPLQVIMNADRARAERDEAKV